jgi:hypothetical protein
MTAPHMEHRDKPPGSFLSTPCFLPIKCLRLRPLFQKLSVTATVGPNRDLTELSKTAGSGFPPNQCTYCTHLAGFYTDDTSPWVLSSIHIQRVKPFIQTQLACLGSSSHSSPTHHSCCYVKVSSHDIFYL